MQQPTRRTLLASAAAATAVTLAGCADDPKPKATATPSPTLDGTRILPEPDTSADPNGPMPADALPEDEQAAADAALATMKVWVKGQSLPQMEWQKQLKPTLASSAQQIYATRQGYKIPDTAIEGKPEVLRSNAATASFRIDTNAGAYEVTVVKIKGEWKTAGITPLHGG